MNCVLEEVDDIGGVAEVESDDEEGGGVVKKVMVGEIDCVLSCEEYMTCKSCKAEMKKVNEVVCKCSKCGMLMKIVKCKTIYVSCKSGCL